MKRSPMPERKTPLRRTPLRVVSDSEATPRPKRHRSTGPRAVQRLVIISRAGGSCEVCGQPVASARTRASTTSGTVTAGLPRNDEEPPAQPG